MTYERLLEVAHEHGITVKEKPLKANKGRIKADRIAISAAVDTSAEKACILAEELGHYHTTAGDIIDQSKIENRKQERRARAWGYEKLVPPVRFIDAYKHGCRNRAETAKYFDVTEEFLNDAVNYYKEKYGTCSQFGRFVVYFDPVGVMEMFRSDSEKMQDL